MPDDFGSVEGDLDLLKQLCLNLLANAIKFSPEKARGRRSRVVRRGRAVARGGARPRARHSRGSARAHLRALLSRRAGAGAARAGHRARPGHRAQHRRAARRPHRASRRDRAAARASPSTCRARSARPKRRARLAARTVASAATCCACSTRRWRVVSDVMEAQIVSAMLVDPERGDLRVAAALGLDESARASAASATAAASRARRWPRPRRCWSTTSRPIRASGGPNTPAVLDQVPALRAAHGRRPLGRRHQRQQQALARVVRRGGSGAPAHAGRPRVVGRRALAGVPGIHRGAGRDHGGAAHVAASAPGSRARTPAAGGHRLRSGAPPRRRRGRVAHAVAAGRRRAGRGAARAGPERPTAPSVRLRCWDRPRTSCWRVPSAGTEAVTRVAWRATPFRWAPASWPRSTLCTVTPTAPRTGLRSRRLPRSSRAGARVRGPARSARGRRGGRCCSPRRAPPSVLRRRAGPGRPRNGPHRPTARHARHPRASPGTRSSSCAVACAISSSCASACPASTSRQVEAGKARMVKLHRCSRWSPGSTRRSTSRACSPASCAPCRAPRASASCCCACSIRARRTAARARLRRAAGARPWPSSRARTSRSTPSCPGCRTSSASAARTSSATRTAFSQRLPEGVRPTWAHASRGSGTRTTCCSCRSTAKSGELVGYLSVDDPVDRLVPSRETIELLEVFANHVVVALENARLYQSLEEHSQEPGGRPTRALGELTRLKSNFLSAISHELRTPLTSIRAYTRQPARRQPAWRERRRPRGLERARSTCCPTRARASRP